MKLKYHRDRILSLQIFLTLIGVSSHQPLYLFVPISPQGFQFYNIFLLGRVWVLEL